MKKNSKRNSYLLACTKVEFKDRQPFIDKARKWDKSRNEDKQEILDTLKKIDEETVNLEAISRIFDEYFNFITLPDGALEILKEIEDKIYNLNYEGTDKISDKIKTYTINYEDLIDNDEDNEIGYNREISPLLLHRFLSTDISGFEKTVRIVTESDTEHNGKVNPNFILEGFDFEIDNLNGMSVLLAEKQRHIDEVILVDKIKRIILCYEKEC